MAVKSCKLLSLNWRILASLKLPPEWKMGSSEARRESVLVSHQGLICNSMCFTESQKSGYLSNKKFNLSQFRQFSKGPLCYQLKKLSSRFHRRMLRVRVRMSLPLLRNPTPAEDQLSNKQVVWLVDLNRQKTSRWIFLRNIKGIISLKSCRCIH